MKNALVTVVTLFALVRLFEAASSLTANQLKVFEAYKNVYYDPVTKLSLESEIESIGRFPYARIGYRSLPCTCQDLSCNCCAGINITRLNFDQKACTSLSFDPHEYIIKLDVAMNDRSIWSNRISARDPPPVCFPFPYLPAIDFCVKFYNVFMPGNNIHACIDLETRVIQSPVFVLHFDCIRIGADGFVWLKPDDNGGLDITNNNSMVSEIAEPEVYDDVNFESNDSAIAANDTSTLSPEDADKIGQLKL